MTDIPEDKDKIIDLVAKMRERGKAKGGRPPGPLGATSARIRQIKAMAKEVIREGAQERLTEQEKEFAELVVNGASLAGAYEQAYPEVCFAIALRCEHKADKPCDDTCEALVPRLSYEQRVTKANSLSKKPDVRSTIITLLAQEEEEVSHTASRLDNFIVKSLEKEANNPLNSASARITALKALSEHRAVQVAESRAGDKAARTSDEVLEAIATRIGQLSGGKKEL